ncbi:HNH endonuclease [Agrobacterium larrymoorei]|uniref:HNH endonuclease n=1 Tax=Agrobacterium larrymoorei TaxID=160699 RepID=A0AAF0KCU1_9HYPH|nr:HNH endonuclease [Agrobacterium larrymoorei]WHA40168.1 HNH endonuclease [Agrobacterium larrymoorei]
MTTKAKPITIALDRLKEVLHYDPLTGIWTWLVRTSTRIHIGDVAGRTDPLGYVRIKVDGIEYLAHRLAWFYMTGDNDPAELDHKDGHPSNNRFKNIREATRSQNTANTRLRTGKTLPKGVSLSANGLRYIAQFVHKRVTRYLGTFDTPAEAHAAYMFAAKDHHGAFARAA